MRRKIINCILYFIIIIMVVTGVYYTFFYKKGNLKIEFYGHNLLMGVNGSYELVYSTNQNIRDKVIFKNSSDEIVRLDNNHIIGLRKGISSITLVYNNQVYDKMDIYVVDDVVPTLFVDIPESVIVENDNISLMLGEEKEVKYSFLPSNAYNYLKLTSSDESIIKVINNKLVGVGVGKTIISCESFNGLIKNINAEVKEIEASDIIVDSNISLNVSEKKVINYQVVPNNATKKEVIFSSSDNSIVIVSNNGEITGIKAGNAIITIKSSDGRISKIINVTVVSNGNKKNNNDIVTSTCNSTDPADVAFTSCLKSSHGLILSSSSITINAGSSGSVNVKLPSECGTNLAYTRKSADGESGWSNYVTQSRSNESSTGFTWIINAKDNAKGKTIILSQTIQYNAKSKGGCTGNIKSMARLTVTIN